MDKTEISTVNLCGFRQSQPYCIGLGLSAVDHNDSIGVFWGVEPHILIVEPLNVRHFGVDMCLIAYVVVFSVVVQCSCVCLLEREGIGGVNSIRVEPRPM